MIYSDKVRSIKNEIAEAEQELDALGTKETKKSAILIEYLVSLKTQLFKIELLISAYEG